MGFEKNNLKSKKNTKSDSKNKNTHFQSQRDETKFKIMETYGISSEEADSAIENIIKKDDVLNSKNNNDISHNDVGTDDLGKKDNVNDYQHDFDMKKTNEEKNTSSKSIQKQIPDEKINENTQISYDSEKQENDQSKPKQDENLVQENNQNSQHQELNEKQNVDEIMESIIPDYNQHLSIEVNHVDLTFEVSNEKVDTIKETFIRTLKRDKSKKLKVHALKDISFKIYKGEKVGIIGYNGAGKSTLLSVITGIYPPNKGFVKTVGNISPMLSLGAGFDHNYSGRKNILLNGAVLGYDKEFLESKVDEIIEFSELGEFIDIPIKNYSSGMIAKLGFSIATAVNPDILIIDEVLGVGDVNFSKKSRDKMRSLMDGGTTVLLVSHSIPQIRELCDKAIWIDNGRLREMGEVNKVCDHYLKDAEKASNEQLANIQLSNN